MTLVDTTMYWSRTGGGVGRYVLTRAHWLTTRAGWQHALVVPRRNGAESPQHTRCIEVGGWPLPGSGGSYRLPLNTAELARRIAEQLPDLIEAGDPFAPAWAAIRVRDASEVPIVAFCHGNLAAVARQACLGGHRALELPGRLAGAGAYRLAAAYLRTVYRHFDVVLAPSQAMARTLRGMGIERVEHQPLGVDREVFQPSRADLLWRRRLEKQLELPSGARLFLYAGRLAPEKHLQLLADAVAALGPRHFLLLQGHGPCRPQGEHVRCLPHERDSLRVARLMASVDVFVHAGDQETFGLAVLEAMACGTPVVVRAAAGLGELVRDGAGIGVDADAPAHDWPEALRAALERPNDCICAALARSAEHDWRRILPSLAARYRQLCLGTPAAANTSPPPPAAGRQPTCPPTRNAPSAS
ncbi:glycosyltransferase [Caldimonas sp. KR1-144]|uniref:glycosyltransferase n=1 Tax=Caldimonas sp. KR1-144 TaxID=3400911 RepID=UPI003C0DCB31